MMAIRTVEIEDRDVDLWERAEARGGPGQLSALLTRLLTSHLNAQVVLSEGMGRIEVEAGLGDSVVTKAFTGVWLVEPDDRGTRTSEEGWDIGTYWGVAKTEGERIAVWQGHCNDLWPPSLTVYDSIEDAEADSAVPPDIAVLARQSEGLPAVLELDI